jgi:hypothetical protein
MLLGEDQKNVLVFFDGPSCFSCVEFWPVFEQTVRVLHEKSLNLKFSYVDLTYNDLQEKASVYHFPQIRLYVFGPKPKEITYNDISDFRKLIDFIEFYAIDP